LMIHFSRSENGLKMLSAFLLSSLFLLVYSWASLVWPGLVWTNQYRLPGVPIKDSIYLSICFLISTCILMHLAIVMKEKGQNWHAAICLVIVLALLANLAFVANSRTAIVLLAFLLPLVGYQRYGWRGAATLLTVALLLGTVAWSTSSYFRMRLSSIIERTLHNVPADNSSEAERIEFWRKSLALIEEAPAIGHGTGSIRSLFEKSQRGTKGAAAVVVANPHNQFFTVGLQLGTIGVTLLWLMWISHLMLFRGDGIVLWLGTLVVFENVLASAFNSHLSDFTAGWLYVMAVGILGGTVLKQRSTNLAVSV
jgi:O-antigen ligase